MSQYGHLVIRDPARGVRYGNRIRALVSGVCLLVGVGAGAAGIFDSNRGKESPGVVPAGSSAGVALVADPAANGPSGMALLQAMQASFRQVAAAALPVVVKIDTTVTPGSRGRFGLSPRSVPSPEFGQPGGTGSGVIVRRDGKRYYVLTNSHVIANTESIQVTLDDGRDFAAELVGRDLRQDIALLSFDGPAEIPVATLGDSSSLVVGDLVLAVGSPFGFQSTVTSGIVSALGRESGSFPRNIAEYIQTDAAINPGNSGGALVNLAGEVVGINTWIASRSGGNVGVGFALPINVAKSAIDQLIRSGEVRYGFLGVYVDSASDEMRAALDVTGIDGALVWSVMLDSPAARGDLRPGDWVTHVDGREVADSNELIRAVGALEPGRDSVFGLRRDGRPLEVAVRVALRDDDRRDRDVRDWPGAFPLHLTDRTRAQFNVPGNVRGLVVAGVRDSSAPGRAGLRRGDVVTHINGTAMRDAADFYRALGERRAGEYRFRIIRNGARETVSFTL